MGFTGVAHASIESQTGLGVNPRGTHPRLFFAAGLAKCCLVTRLLRALPALLAITLYFAAGFWLLSEAWAFIGSMLIGVMVGVWAVAFRLLRRRWPEDEDLREAVRRIGL